LPRQWFLPVLGGPAAPKSTRFAQKVIFCGKGALFPQKSFFLRKSRFWREKLKFGSQNGKKWKMDSKTPKKALVL